MRSACLFRGVVVFVLGLGAAFSFAGCSSDEVPGPSYLRVELIPAVSAPQAARAVRVAITDVASSVLIASLCVNIEGMSGSTTASFVLQRDTAKPANARIAIEVTPFDVLDGQDSVQPGKEFTCPMPLPAALGSSTKVSVDFCATETRTLVFHVGAECCNGSGGSGGGAGACGCEMGFVCGAGLTNDGNACGPTDCCSQAVSSACDLGK